MASPLAHVPICMLGGDTREVLLAEALVKMEADLRLVGFISQGERPTRLTLPIRCRQPKAAGWS